MRLNYLYQECVLVFWYSGSFMQKQNYHNMKANLAFETLIQCKYTSGIGFNIKKEHNNEQTI